MIRDMSTQKDKIDWIDNTKSPHIPSECCPIEKRGRPPVVSVLRHMGRHPRVIPSLENRGKLDGIEATIQKSR